MNDGYTHRGQCSKCGYEMSTQTEFEDTGRSQHLASLAPCPLCRSMTIQARRYGEAGPFELSEGIRID